MIELNGTEIKPTIFPDQTSQVWQLDRSLLSNPTGPFSVKWWFSKEDELIHLSQLKMLLDELHYYIPKLLYIPYLPYARQDKDTSNSDTFALTPFCGMLNRMSWDTIFAFDPHSDTAGRQIARFVSVAPTFNLTPLIATHDVVIFPDQGAYRRYRSDIEGKPYFVAEKVRDQQTGRITEYDIPNLTGQLKGKKVLVIDDLCDGGATFKLLANLFHNVKNKVEKPVELNLYVSHGVFSKGLSGLLNWYNRIYTTNSTKHMSKNGIFDATYAMDLNERNRIEILPSL